MVAGLRRLLNAITNSLRVYRPTSCYVSVYKIILNATAKFSFCDVTDCELSPKLAQHDVCCAACVVYVVYAPGTVFFLKLANSIPRKK